MVVVHLQSGVHRRAKVAGIVMVAIDAGAEVGLPSSMAVPAMALASEVGSGGCNVEQVCGFSVAPKGNGGGGQQQLRAGTRCSGMRDVAFFIHMSEPAKPVWYIELSF